MLPTSKRTLDEWLAWQSRLHPREIELGLDRVRAVWNELGSPAPARTVITVGGTNGKGSTVAFLEAILRAGEESRLTASTGRTRVSNSRLGGGGISRSTVAESCFGPLPLNSIGTKMMASAIRTTAPSRRCFKAGSMGWPR
jgi:hypothetical protein